MDEENMIPADESSEVEASEQAETLTMPKAEIDSLRQEVRESKEKYLHALAEGENSRKRL